MSFSVPGGADATVRGRYELTADAALRTLTSLRDRGREADAALKSLGQRMDTLAVKVSRPRVELTGFDRVNAQLSELEARLDRLDRRSATSRVRLGGGFGGFGDGGGGGGQGIVAGNSGSGLFSSLGGIPGRLPWWAAAVPLAPQLLGGAGALLSSAGGAALGAGVVGLGGAAPLAAGAGLTLAVARPAIQAIQTITKAQDAYTLAVERYGRASAQAATQARTLNAAVAANPAAAGAARQLGGFRQAWRSATADARTNVYGGVSGVLYNARRATPTIGAAATAATGATATAATSFSGFLAQPAEQAMLMQLTGAFARELPLAERSAENLVTTFGHLAIQAIPFFHEANVWVTNWTTGLARSSADGPRVHAGMQQLVTDARAWARLTGAAARDVRDLFSPGQQAGNSMVMQLTGTLNRWDVWLRNNPDRVRQFFRDGERGVSRIATVLGNLTADLFRIFQGLNPILTRAEQFLQFASGLGGGNLLLGGGLLYGAYQGARGALGGRGPSPAAAAGSFILGRPLRGGGAAGAAAVAGRATDAEVAAGRTASGAFLMPAGPGPGLASRVGAGARTFGAAALGGAARVVVPLAALQGLIGLAQPVDGGGFGARIENAASSLTFGLVPGYTSPGAAGNQAAQAFLQAHPNVGTGGIQAEISRLRRGALAPGTTRIGTLPAGLSGPRAPHLNQPEINALTAAWNQAWTQQVAASGSTAAVGFEDAFTRGLQRGVTPGRAVNQLLGGVTRQVQTLGPAGARAWSRDLAQWVQEMEADNPRLQRPLNRLMQGIVAQINRMNNATGSSLEDLQRKVFFINGQILTGSSKTWAAISSALVNPMHVAEETLSGTFKSIQQQAIDALTSMGYTRQAARQVVLNLGTPSSARNQAGDIARNTLGLAQGQNPQGTVLTSAGQTITLPGAAGRPHHARGGMLSGHGGLDTIQLPNGDRAAPGEAYIANRHTMNDLTRATLRMYGKTAWQMIRDERRQHAYQTGGGIPPTIQANSTAGHPELKPGISRAVAAVLGMFPGLSITSTTGGGHAAGSYHYLGEAADLGADAGTMFRAAQWINSSGLSRQLAEGIHNPNLSVKFGQGVPSSYWGASTWAEHLNHIHMAVGPFNAGVLTGGVAGGGGAVGAMASPLRLRAPRSGMRGVPGALLNHASMAFAAGLQAAVNARTGAAGITAAGFSGGGNATANQQLGLRMMLAAGWPASEWPALQSLWNQESGWSSTAVNASSGAAGIPQALGHGHPFALGDAPAQIAWGLNYIRGRYGSPAAAWAHEQAHNWYQTGGRVNWAGWNARGGRFSVNSPTLFGAGERGKRENVSITPAGKGGHGVTVNFHGVTFVGGDKRGLESIAEQVAVKIIDALDGTDGGSSDRQLMGAHS